MANLLFIIFVNLIFSTSVSFGEDACSNYEDKDCVHPNILKNGHFINQWSVYLPGKTKNQARQILEDIGFEYLGQVMDGVDLHLCTKKGTPEKHALPNEKIIELLKKHDKVHSVAQKHVLDNSLEEVTHIVEENNVHLESLDPKTIMLNDGSDNLERIAAFETAAEESNNTKSADNGVSSSENKTPSESSDEENSDEENLDEENLDEKSSDEETLNEKSSDEETLNEKSSDEETLNEKSSDEETLNEKSSDEETLNEKTMDKESSSK